MIVNIAAWFYLVNAGLGLLSVLLSPFGFMSASTLVTLIYTGLVGAMGYGLLRREKWGWFMGLGSSLLGWTLGALMLIGLIGYLLLVAKVGALLGLLFVGGMFGAIAWIVFLALMLWLVGVVISFKLFWHLCSPDGCQEFGAPPISAPTVVASAGAWLGLGLLNFVFTGGGRFTDGFGDMGASHDSAQVDREQSQRELEARRAAARAQAQAENDAEEELNPDEQAAGEPTDEAGSAEASEFSDASDASDAMEEAEAPASDVADASPQGDAPPAVSDAPPAVSDAPPSAAPVAQPEAEESAPSSRKIIKCRDSAGAITFTQGYCPPGTRKVDMESSE